jgi:hypothetical protein
LYIYILSWKDVVFSPQVTNRPHDGCIQVWVNS